MSQHYNYLLRNNSTVAGLDYSQVECLERKRLLAFVNHFVTRTAHFLSSFTIQCEQRLDNINRKIGGLENELALLEFKLNSVPRINSDQVNNVDDNSRLTNHEYFGKLGIHFICMFKNQIPCYTHVLQIYQDFYLLSIYLLYRT